MYRRQNHLIFSPSDLTHYLESPFVTWMDRLQIEQPDTFECDAETEMDNILATKGLEHEQAYLAKLQADGRDVFDARSADDKFAATNNAMRDGREIIYQAELKSTTMGSHFSGKADFLIKIPGGTQAGSTLADYHYEPWDTKLARSAKPNFLIQLACYADMLADIQGFLPANMHLVLGDKTHQSFRTEDYIYYFRQLRQGFLEQQDNWEGTSPPDSVGMENFGRWSGYAESKMEEQDHLCRVANIRSVQLKKLQAAGIKTMRQLSESTATTVPKMKEDTFAVLKQQARLQIESKGLDKPKYALILPQANGKGLAALPPSSPLDVFFDMEGYPLTDGGLEYLFGATVLDAPNASSTHSPGSIENMTFLDWWAHDSQQEKRAFEEFVDWVYARWQQDPTMHIYHYAPYEMTALRKLMNKYATREREVDDLLRHEVMVDLYAVVKQAIRVGEPKYSIKNIEHLYKDKREGEVATAMDSVVFYEHWLQLKDGDEWQTSKILGDIRAYNKEDCDSTWLLAEWLRGLQREHGLAWAPRESAEQTPAQSDAVGLRDEVQVLAARMLEGIPANPDEKTDGMRVREILAYLLEFHWREAKPVFWAKYDRAKMTEDQLFEDVGCLAGLVRDTGPPQTIARSFGYGYTFNADQDTKIGAKDNCFFAHDLGEKIIIDEIDTDKGTAVLKRGQGGSAPPDRLSLIKDEYVDAGKISDSIRRTAEALMNGQPLPPALEDFLLRRPPRVSGWSAGPLIHTGTNLTDSAVDIISRLDNGALCIQGPPGSGKTHTSAHAIVALIGQGRRVGITSNSHRAIANLMDKVAEVALADGQALRGAKVQSKPDDFHIQSRTSITALTTDKLFKTGANNFDLIGGTAWLFSNEDAVGMVDYLFVDEAGQVSIANLVGMAPSTNNLVLMGDQMQLSQPLQGTHPGESGQSILEYLLQGKQVVPDDFGIFLGTSWRMHPDVCRFISGAIYEDRLKPESHTVERVIEMPASAGKPTSEMSKLTPAGILYVPVEHEGNTQGSDEEVAAIAQIVEALKKCSVVNGSDERPLTLNDILIVAPYNVQVRALLQALPGARVGSVDKFQGQEAAVAIISMCSSSGDASPRGLDFIFSKNRLNVAISRAQSLAIVVGTPALARTSCNQVKQVELVNLFCRAVSEVKAVQQPSCDHRNSN